ncbi:MAG: hypothetical protein IJG24_02750, partial [Selenomonadaceae bacterium]|nr:hypothetical protein [Selenomonadaceae bacterium]
KAGTKRKKRGRNIERIFHNRNSDGRIAEKYRGISAGAGRKKLSVVRGSEGIIRAGVLSGRANRAERRFLQAARYGRPAGNIPVGSAKSVGANPGVAVAEGAVEFGANANLQHGRKPVQIRPHAENRAVERIFPETENSAGTVQAG